ncbi:hypothetical protein GGF31_003504 [Allomyces arbusculus]|nr:hypothetical protein GGF31_003504 [Allomyces arbusculus]
MSEQQMPDLHLDEWKPRLIGKVLILDESSEVPEGALTRADLPERHRLCRNGLMDRSFFADRITVHLDANSVITELSRG